MKLTHELSTRLGPLLRIRPQVSTEVLALAASVFFALACNSQFLRAALAGRIESDPSTWMFGGAMVVMLTMLHLFLLLLVLHRSVARELLSVLLIATAFATYYMQRFGVFMDPSMLRNVLRTDVAEARELFSLGMLPHLVVFAGLPLLLLWRVQITKRSLVRSLALRGLALVATGVLMIGSVFVVYQDFSALMRNQKEMRYLVTPANFLYSTARVLTADTRQAAVARLTVGADAQQGASWSARPRPTMLVLAIGETARAANWGLNGYVRQTTPELAKQDVLNFTDVTACGTNTETSLPCMFSAVGRRNYDEERIRGSESLLHVLN